MTDSYRPDQQSNRNRNARDAYSNMYRFGGDNYRPSNGQGDHRRPKNSNAQNDFSFRPGIDAPSYPRNRPNRNDFGPSRRDGRNRDPQRRFDRRTRGGYRPPAPSERPILRSQREKTPDQLNGTEGTPAKFVLAEDMSESETDMDLDSEMDGEVENDEEDIEPSNKRTKIEDTSNSVETSLPRWSNPDPYTSLPPPDESKAKRKDVVKLIRKAKITQEVLETPAIANDVTTNADFISLSFGDEKNDVISISSSSSTDDFFKRDIPKGPRSFSHLENLHPDRVSGPPGTSSQQMNLREPPPHKDFSTLPSAKDLGYDLGRNRISHDTWPAATDQTLRNDAPIEMPPAPPKTRKRKRQGFELDGSIVEEWVSQKTDTATPWCIVDHSQTENVGLWLHKEICDFYEYVKPKPFEYKIRNDLVNRVQDVLGDMFPSTRVLAFGSFASGLYLPTADMDLVLVSHSYETRGVPHVGQSKRALYRASHKLEATGTAEPQSCEVIASAKVPIVKFVDRKTGLKVDISFDNLTGVVAIGTFEKWKAEYPAMPILTTIIKQYLLMRGLNEVYTGGLGGFTVTCLVTSLLQNHPASQSNNLNPENNLGEMLMNFFDLYGNKLNTTNTRISMNPAGYIPKNGYNLAGRFDNNPDRLSIIDPNKPDNDISNGSHKIELVQKSFSEAYKQLQQCMYTTSLKAFPDRRGSSILASILGGDYSSFQWQRYLLKKIHDKT